MLYSIDDEENDGKESDEENSRGGPTIGGLTPEFIDGHTVESHVSLTCNQAIVGTSGDLRSRDQGIKVLDAVAHGDRKHECSDKPDGYSCAKSFRYGFLRLCAFLC